MDDQTGPSPWQTQDSRFEVHTRLEPLDYLHWMGAVRWRPIEQFVAWLAAVGMSGMGAILALLLLDPLTERLPSYPYWSWDVAIAIGGALVAFLIYKVFVMGPYIDSMFYGQPIGMGETTIVADKNGVSSTSAGVDMRVPWDKVQDVIVGSEHLFLMFSRVVGFIVPRRAFANDGEAERFADFVRRMTHKPA
jgi:hypothetical protein